MPFSIFQFPQKEREKRGKSSKVAAVMWLSLERRERERERKRKEKECPFAVDDGLSSDLWRPELRKEEGEVSSTFLEEEEEYKIGPQAGGLLHYYTHAYLCFSFCLSAQPPPLLLSRRCCQEEED